MLSGPQLNCQTKAIQTHNGQPRRPRVCHAPSQRDKSLSKIPTRERQALSEPRAQPLARRESQELAQGWAAIEPSITRAIRFSVEGLRGEVSVPGALPCSESRPNPMWWHCSSTHTHKRRTHQTVREGREKCVCRGKSRRLYPPPSASLVSPAQFLIDSSRPESGCPRRVVQQKLPCVVLRVVCYVVDCWLVACGGSLQDKPVEPSGSP